MQLGCLAFADIIHVSAQPVIPSDGTTASTLTFSPFRKLTWYGQVVPTVVVPLV
jgi:hypothetical protein